MDSYRYGEKSTKKVFEQTIEVLEARKLGIGEVVGVAA